MPKIQCPHCNQSVAIEGKAPAYCPFCGSRLSPEKAMTQAMAETTFEMGFASTKGTATLVHGHEPEAESVQFNVGSYQVVNAIGKGGMGEVFLAYDPNCGRRIALKRIRSDLLEHKQMHNRFLKEARITSQLTHPSIIPIYAIHSEEQQTYYTMPFVEGETLKEILRTTQQQVKKGEKLHHTGGSIPALVRIFINICQAIAYAHSKGVLHRDIKPENIIVGRYGEVLILDWGLAKMVHSGAEGDAEESFEELPTHHLHQLTNIGKVVGTVSYMAPERALGAQANIQTDIYSLGVILYQILTLTPPFKRGSLKEFRENLHLEVVRDPAIVAPYRDVPRDLARIALKCMSVEVENRYPTVDTLIHDLENYIEGRAEWFEAAKLDVRDHAQWEFQENVLIAEHTAITRGTDVSDWVSLMIAKQSFSENLKIEAEVKLGDHSQGIGFLFCVPEASERQHLNDGYCLWLGTDQNRSTKLLRSTVEVMHDADHFLERNAWTKVKIKKIENKILVYLNGQLRFSYISHMPLMGTHVGIMSRDADFEIRNYQVFLGSQSVLVNCLAVPDSLLAHKLYDSALSEYRRIGYSFPGRAEGREAMFRAGICLLEQASDTKDKEEAARLYDLALAEFEKLHGTPGAPLEYLGKALVYEALGDRTEEIKCFELAFRRYPRHPLLSILQEQMIYRMHSVSRIDRQAAYNYALLVVRHLPKTAASPLTKTLFTSLKRHWEPLPFIEESAASPISDLQNNRAMGIVLAFWLAKPYVLEEIVQEQIRSKTPLPVHIWNALYCLVELGCHSQARQLLTTLNEERPEIIEANMEAYRSIHVVLIAHEKTVEEAFKAFAVAFKEPYEFHERRALLHLYDESLRSLKPEPVIRSTFAVEEAHQLEFDVRRIQALLLEKNWGEASNILHKYPLELLNQETTPLHFLYGCWLYATEGREIAAIHFSGVLEVSYPRSWTLLSHFHDAAPAEIESWLARAFLWEKRQFYRQFAYFNATLGNTSKAHYYLDQEKKEYVEDTQD